MSKRTAKVVTVGDGGCGKSSLLVRFCKDEFLHTYEPTMFENYVAEIEFRPQYNMELTLFDTAGHTAYDRLRPLSYPDCDVVLVCFDLSQPGGIKEVEAKWIPELDKFCPHVPFILVGCKVDARHLEAVVVEDTDGQQKALNEREPN
ncbi:rho-related GTP-binding protein RhoA-B-like isoform X2 [Corticium candelabrum]|uniref:rho-related GTP-binding protein RhoA-B-like isoform X2 n=1 Tax=Corticium candelabrum TaxID=121492 RepID=UPI002E273CDC|nr:rho-related GTP-binding protein RhoA-B-like isoform X2 [Corticium candelabrum]